MVVVAAIVGIEVGEPKVVHPHTVAVIPVPISVAAITAIEVVIEIITTAVPRKHCR